MSKDKEETAKEVKPAVDASNKKAPAQPKKNSIVPKVLSTFHISLVWMGLVKCIAVLVVSGCVLHMMADENRSGFLWSTQLGPFVEMVFMKFPFLLAGFFNGSLLGVFMLVQALAGHRAGLELEKTKKTS
mmetsp:Transcript_21791/g.30311  ORF Transcript_21791/g.30311 Transcript_21791/m.30311 type:complete len:130 (-) Transcript_21791:32-421(-)